MKQHICLKWFLTLFWQTGQLGKTKVLRHVCSQVGYWGEGIEDEAWRGGGISTANSPFLKRSSWRGNRQNCWEPSVAFFALSQISDSEGVVWKCAILFWKVSSDACDIHENHWNMWLATTSESSSLYLHLPILPLLPCSTPSYCKVSKGTFQIGWNNLNISTDKEEVTHSEVMFLKPYKRLLYSIFFLSKMKAIMNIKWN